MRNEHSPRRWQQSSWPGYDQRDDGWSDNRSERWAQDDWMAESEGDDWESARRRRDLTPWQLSEGGPSRDELRYGGDHEGSRGGWSSSRQHEDDRGWDIWRGSGHETGGRAATPHQPWRGAGGSDWRRGGQHGGGTYRGDDDRGVWGNEYGGQYGGRYGSQYQGQYPGQYPGQYRYARGGSHGTVGEDEWSGRATQYGDYERGDDERDYADEDDRRAHGPLYRLGRRIGEAVGNLFGDEDSERPRGPKGYRRSDERIREAVCERLAYAEGIDVSDVTVDVEGGIVKLGGTVAHRSEKYDIEDMVEKEFGVTDVENDIRVRRDAGADTSDEATDVRNWRSDWT